MVADKKNVSGIEHYVMAEVHQEIGNAIIKNQTLKRGIRRVEIAGGIGKYSTESQENRWSSMEKGDNTTGSFRTELGSPIPEEYEVRNEINKKKI